MDDLSDEELVALHVKSGALAPVDELIRRHTGRVRRMVYSIVLNDSDADDLSQDVFIRAVRALPRFRRRATFTTWIHRIAVNTALAHLRRHNRTKEYAKVAPEDGADSAPGPDGVVMGRETADGVGRALALLSPTLRAAITLTAINGLSVQEAARAADCVRATMYWRVHEARRQLRRHLEMDA